MQDLKREDHMDIKAVNNSKDKQNQIQAKQPEKGVSTGKTAPKKGKAADVSDRITLSSTGLDRNSSEKAAEQARNLILADSRTAVLSIGNVEHDRAVSLLQ